MYTFLYFLLVLFSLISYFVLSTRMGIYQEYPIVHFLGAIIGLGLLIRQTIKQFTRTRLTASIVAGALLLLFMWYTLDYSVYENTTANIATGDVVDAQLREIPLLSPAGDTLRLGDEIARHAFTLVVLNRGHW
ncbi:MAG: hypothetical protein D6681_05285 [Calditrichaeota bacterium]|nr:MAG: hypothetical protein D6681_05285 [Calditrichota bacterium]